MAPSFADLLNDDSKNKLNRHRFAVGSVFVARLNESDGITPKGTDLFRNKMFIVVGHDQDGIEIGVVLINSDINPYLKYSKQLNSLQLLLKQCDYPKMLDHDSHVNCSELFSLTIDTLKDFRLLFELSIDQLKPILNTVKGAVTISNKRKRHFGLL